MGPKLSPTAIRSSASGRRTSPPRASKRVPRVAGVAGRSAGSRRRPRPGRGERDLVHGVPLRLRLDRSARPRRRMASPLHDRGVVGSRTGSVLHRARVPVLVLLGRPPGHGDAITPSWRTTSPRGRVDVSRALASSPRSVRTRPARRRPPSAASVDDRRPDAAPSSCAFDVGSEGSVTRLTAPASTARPRDARSDEDRAAVRGRLVRPAWCAGTGSSCCPIAAGRSRRCAGSSRDGGEIARRRPGFDRTEPTVRRARRRRSSATRVLARRGGPVALLHAGARRPPRRRWPPRASRRSGSTSFARPDAAVTASG